MASVDLGTPWILCLANDMHTWVDQSLAILQHLAGYTWVGVGVVGRFGDTMRWVREVIAGRLPTVGATVRDGCARRPHLRWGRCRLGDVDALALLSLVV